MVPVQLQLVSHAHGQTEYLVELFPSTLQRFSWVGKVVSQARSHFGISLLIDGFEL